MTFSQACSFFAAKLCEHDKRLHITWSLCLMLVARILWPAPWAFAAVFLLGFAKECWDSRYGSGFCLFDMFANLVGITLALILADLWSRPLFEP